MIKTLKGKCYKIESYHTTEECHVCGIKPENQRLYRFGWQTRKAGCVGDSIAICMRCLQEINELTTEMIRHIQENDIVITENA